MRLTVSLPLLLVALGCATTSTSEFKSPPPGVEVWRYREGEPTKPTSYAIRKGIARIVPEVAACSEAHGADPGTKLRMKFAIAGQTGRVSSAEALPPWVGTPLEDCVIEALAQAEFPEFEKSSVGVVYPFLL